jgi:hypothetical protein
MGRLLGHPVVMPRSLLRTYLNDTDRELTTSKFGGPRLALVNRVPTPTLWAEVLPIVRRELGLARTSSSLD